MGGKGAAWMAAWSYRPAGARAVESAAAEQPAEQPRQGSPTMIGALEGGDVGDYATVPGDPEERREAALWNVAERRAARAGHVDPAAGWGRQALILAGGPLVAPAVAGRPVALPAADDPEVEAERRRLAALALGSGV